MADDGLMMLSGPDPTEPTTNRSAPIGPNRNCGLGRQVIECLTMKITVASVGGRNSQGDSEINQLSNLTKIFRLGEAPALGQHDSFTRALFIFWARL